MKNARLPKNEKTSAPSKRKFTGTENPRHLRVLRALQTRPRTREDVDRIAGASNGPELMAELRRRGLDAPCSKTPCIDKDGMEVMRGIYYLTDADKARLSAWLERRAKGGRP